MAAASCSLAGLVLANRYQQARLGGLAGSGAADLNPLQRVYLQTYLAGRAEELEGAAGEGDTTVSVTIPPGANAETIAHTLADAGVLRDPELFLNYAAYTGQDAELEAGDYQLSPALTIPQLATALTQSSAQTVELRFLEGWRAGEMADYLRMTAPALIDGDAFLAINRRETPFDTGPYPFLAALPPDAPLEGYLFPDTYRAPLDAAAADLADLMLRNFGRRVDPAMRQAFGGQGLSLREAVTLASIVEREAVVEGERPLIAGVFLNRLEMEMMLQADPTVQYALGRQPDGDWWKSPLTAADLAVDSPYNTYAVTGLPPGPIANPGLASLRAVADAAVTDYLYFVAGCDPDQPGAHRFSATYAAHLENVNRCR